MSTYKCPICQQETPRDLVIFLDHTDQHIIDEIKKQYPEWVNSDGMCQKCAEHYKGQFKK
jgi:hypothetical protein